MELSKEVHGLLERIKKLSQQAHKTDSYSSISSMASTIAPLGPISQMYSDPSVSFQEEPLCTSDQLIKVENMDFSDVERWLYVSDIALQNPFSGDLQEWLRQDFTDSSITKQFLELEATIDRKLLDSKTILNEESEPTYQPSPVHFKLNEPVYNTSFERILATASEAADSFTNMSPPSLMNSLCSSTFTTLMDSGYVNQEVPNITEIENDDPNKSLNDTYNIHNYNDLNSTFHKSNTNTYKKPKSSPSTLKSSCPDINKTFHKNHDCSLDLTFQKLSDSQPNLTEDLKRTILNQSMELMNTDVFHTARSGSADSLDERSSSISNSSRGSGKILDTRDLETLAKVQEKMAGLHNHAISTPTKPNTVLALEGDIFSPIRRDSSSDLSRSGSDLSESCVTARSGLSKRSSPARSDVGDLEDRFRARAPPSRPNSRPEMIVKPMEINRTIVHSRPQTVPSNMIRPKVRTSGLPRPTMGTGIPRPMSRIPGPKSIRPPHRPSQLQRPAPKSDWMDGCY